LKCESMSVRLTELEKKITTMLARMKKDGVDVFGHRELAEFFNKDPRVFNGYLIKFSEMGILRYKGRKKNQHTYSISDKVYDLLTSIIEPAEEKKLIERRKQKVTRQVFGKKLFTTTKEEVTEISPKPSELSRESESSLSTGIGVSQMNVKASYTKKDRRKMEFEENR